jgi:hypothetical protein
MKGNNGFKAERKKFPSAKFYYGYRENGVFFKYIPKRQDSKYFITYCKTYYTLPAEGRMNRCGHIMP